MSIFIDGITGIVAMYAAKFQKNELNLTFFSKYESPLEIMNILYNSLTGKKELEKIENLPLDVKQKLWNSAKSLCPNSTQQKVIKMCNAIWLLNSIMENV